MCPKSFKTKVPWRDDGVDVEELDWPRHFDYIGCVAPVLIALAVLFQRDALVPPQLDVLWAGLAVLPWCMQLVHRRPPRLLMVVLVLGSTFMLYRSGADSPTPYEDLTPFILVVLAMEIGALAPLRESLLVFAATVGSMVVAHTVMPHPTMDVSAVHAMPWYVGIACGWVGGVMIQSQLRALTALKAAQADLAERAASNERQRIAHELHDVIAHSLTVTMLHVTGARKALQRSSEEAAEALEQAERLGRQSLSDVRRVVGVLGAGGPAEHAPLPDATDVRKLVEDVNAAGAEVTLDIMGDLGAVTPTTSLALYRIVQESLTNAAKHSPGAPTNVVLDVHNGVVKLEISNPLPERRIESEATADGLGLWGMKERVQVLGGSFEAGAVGDRWVVRATAPTAATRG